MSDKKHVLIEYLNSLNDVIINTFQRMKRIKLKSFDVSKHFIVFGASTGGIYIFKKNPCEFVKLIPSKEGSADKVSISPDEKNIGIASANGLIVIIEDFCSDSSSNYQVYNEHENQIITALKWQGNDLYCGDINGKISVVSPTTLLTKAIFQTPSATLMQLDSSIVQIDSYLNFLLISTKTKTYLCDTEKEQFKQMGKKLRDGQYGACFFNTSNESKNTYSSQTNTRNTYTTLSESETFLPSAGNDDTKMYCARPGARLWEVNFEAAVLTTRQFKGARNLNPPDIAQICDEKESIVFNDTKGMLQLPSCFNFKNLYNLKNQFILTFDEKGMYVFDPCLTELIYWSDNFKDIKELVIIDDLIYLWFGTSHVKVFSIFLLEDSIVNSLLRQQYYLAVGLCTHYEKEVLALLKTSKKLQILCVLKKKITDPEVIKSLKGILDAIDKIHENNSKIRLPPKTATGVVRVDNSAYNGSNRVDKNKCKDSEVQLYKHIEFLFKQYKLNKTHSVIIPDVSKLLKPIDLDNLHTLFILFNHEVKEKYNEDTTYWSHYYFLSQAIEKRETLKALNLKAAIYLCKSFLVINRIENGACTCGFPLPKCGKKDLKFKHIGTVLCQHYRDMIDEEYLKQIPCLYKQILLQSEEPNMALMLQLSNKHVFERPGLVISYDKWDEALQLYIKLCDKLCLNCGATIDNTHKITWTDLGLIMIRSIGSKNAMKLFDRYANSIPRGQLDNVFYQASIFSSSLEDHGESNTLIAEILKPVQSEAVKKDLEKLVHAYLTQKGNINSNGVDMQASSSSHTAASDRKCASCKLSLNAEFLKGSVTKNCGHEFHSFCYGLLKNGICRECQENEQGRSVDDPPVPNNT